MAIGEDIISLYLRFIHLRIVLIFDFIFW